MIDLKREYGHRFRISFDASAAMETIPAERVWLHRIPCRYGFIGVHGPEVLMAHTCSRRLLPRLLSIPGVVVRQRGDDEFNLCFPPEQMDAVAAILQARRPRKLNALDRERLIDAGRRSRFAGRTDAAPGAPCDDRPAA